MSEKCGNDTQTLNQQPITVKQYLKKMLFKRSQVRHEVTTEIYNKVEVLHVLGK